MSHLSKFHPWNPHYALPPSVKAEPAGRGAFVTKWLPRGTFVDQPKDMGRPPAQNWVLPNYVKAEPLERGTFTSKWASRRTVGKLGPDMLSHGGQLVKSSLSGDSLGASEMPQGPDPIQLYGTQAAKIVLVEMSKVPAKDRPLMMKRILDGIDPALIAKVNARLKANKAKGMAQGPALRQALEESFREGLTSEFERIGKSRSVKNTPGAVATGLGIDIGGSIKGLFSGHVSAAKKIGGVACKTATHPGAALAAGAGAAYYGKNPENVMAGVTVASNLCGGPAGQYPADAFPWVPVALVGGAALLAIVLVTRD